MELDEITESKIEKIASRHMENSRPGWGVHHMEAAVFYMKQLIQGEGGNPRILIPTMYFHDIGYEGLLGREYTHSQGQNVKKLHMVRGAEMSRKILQEIGGFSSEEVDEIAHLISIHDDLTQIQGHNIQLVFEADCLAMVDTDRIKPTYAKNDYAIFLERFKRRRQVLFKTKTGLGLLGPLLEKAEGYYS